jgi:hypothetical protein
MKNTRKIKKRKNTRKTKYNKKLFKKHSSKVKYLLKGGTCSNTSNEAKCPYSSNKTPFGCPYSSKKEKKPSEPIKTNKEEDPQCPYGPTKEELEYCESYNDKEQAKEKEKCFKDLNESYVVTPGYCNFKTCCGDCNEFCYPVRDIWRNGAYVPLKYTYDAITGTITATIGGMFAFTMTGMFDGAIKGAIAAASENLPDLEKIADKFGIKNINPSALTGIGLNAPGASIAQPPVQNPLPSAGGGKSKSKRKYRK